MSKVKAGLSFLGKHERRLWWAALLAWLVVDQLRLPHVRGVYHATLFDWSFVVVLLMCFAAFVWSGRESRRLRLERQRAGEKPTIRARTPGEMLAYEHGYGDAVHDVQRNGLIYVSLRVDLMRDTRRAYFNDD